MQANIFWVLFFRIYLDSIVAQPEAVSVQKPLTPSTNRIKPEIENLDRKLLIYLQFSRSSSQPNSALSGSLGRYQVRKSNNGQKSVFIRFTKGENIRSVDRFYKSGLPLAVFAKKKIPRITIYRRIR